MTLMEDESMPRLREWFEDNAEELEHFMRSLDDPRYDWDRSFLASHKDWERDLMLKAMGPTRN